MRGLKLSVKVCPVCRHCQQLGTSPALCRVSLPDPRFPRAMMEQTQMPLEVRRAIIQRWTRMMGRYLQLLSYFMDAVRNLHILGRFGRMRDRIAGTYEPSTTALSLTSAGTTGAMREQGLLSWPADRETCLHSGEIRSYGGHFGRVRLCTMCGSRWRQVAENRWAEMEPKPNPGSTRAPLVAPSPKGKAKAEAKAESRSRSSQQLPSAARPPTTTPGGQSPAGPPRSAPSAPRLSRPSTAPSAAAQDHAAQARQSTVASLQALSPEQQEMLAGLLTQMTGSAPPPPPQAQAYDLTRNDAQDDASMISSWNQASLADEAEDSENQEDPEENAVSHIWRG